MQMPPTETLKTERLLLEIVTPQHYDYLFKQCSKEETMKFIGWENDEDYEV